MSSLDFDQEPSDRGKLDSEESSAVVALQVRNLRIPLEDQITEVTRVRDNWVNNLQHDPEFREGASERIKALNTQLAALEDLKQANKEDPAKKSVHTVEYRRHTRRSNTKCPEKV